MKKSKTIKANVSKTNSFTNELKERRMRPGEWAVEHRLDPCLFAFWNNSLITEKEFEQLKRLV